MGIKSIVFVLMVLASQYYSNGLVGRFLALLCAIGCQIILVSLFWPQPENAGGKRRMSFSSELMARGSMPADKFSMECFPVISSVLYFETLPSKENLVELGNQLMKFERFACIPEPAENGEGYVWTKTESTADRHVQPVIDVKNSDEAHREMERIVMQNLSTPADIPFWEFIPIRNASGPQILVTRVHHAVGDGISLVKVFMPLLTDLDNKPLNHDNNPIQKKFKEAANKPMFKFSIGLILQIIIAAVKAITIPFSSFDSNLLFTNQKKKEKFSATERKVLIMPTLPLDFVKSLKNKAQVSINDVMFGATAGAVRRYCEELKDPELSAKKQLQFRALLPFAFPRKQNASAPLRNLWCFLSAPFPINQTSPLARVKAANTAMNVLKTTPMAPVSLALQNFFGSVLPLDQLRQTAYDTFSRHSIVFSNVPGPPEPVKFAKEQIIAMQMVFPNIIPQVGILSYAGQVFYNITLDPTIVKDYQKLAHFFLEEINQLAESLDISPIQI